MESVLPVAQKILIWAVPALFAITLHEVAHGWAARALGDPTAHQLRRLSLNPLRHVDPVGTLLVPLMTYLTTHMLFGWAKPVPVIARNFRNPRRDMALVALAGPLSNLAMAVVWGLLAKWALTMPPQQGFDGALRLVSLAGIEFNLWLMAFNLLPIPPLDGSRVVAGALSDAGARQFYRIEPYGFLILLGLMGLHLLMPLIGPIYGFARTLTLTALGLYGIDN
jgi:Zn-dependent protease